MLQAFALVRRLVKQDFYREFLDEVVQKLGTFNLPVLSNLLQALAELSKYCSRAWRLVADVNALIHICCCSCMTLHSLYCSADAMPLGSQR